MQSFNVRPANSPSYKISLFSLDEYEREGGRFSDAGNGGEDMTDERGSFVCAAKVQDTHGDGLAESDVLAAAGYQDFWLDSATGFFLLRELSTGPLLLPTPEEEQDDLFLLDGRVYRRAEPEDLDEDCIKVLDGERRETFVVPAPGREPAEGWQGGY